MDDETAASYIDTDLNFVLKNAYLEESEIISKRKIKTESKSSFHMERLSEILQKRGNHERGGTNFALKQL